MGRTILHIEPVMRGGPKRPAGISQLLREQRGLHLIGGTGGAVSTAPRQRESPVTRIREKRPL